MLPTGFSPGYAPSPLLNRRERRQPAATQQPSLPAEVMFGARVQKVSVEDKAAKEHRAKKAGDDATKKELDLEKLKKKLEEQRPRLQQEIDDLTSALEQASRTPANQQSRLRSEVARDAKRRAEKQTELVNLIEEVKTAERVYQTAQKKADELAAEAHGKTREEEEREKKEAALNRSGVVVNNYLSGEAGKKTEGATEVKSTTGTAAKTDSKADGKNPRADFITQRVEDESNRIALDLDYYFGHENLKTNSTLQTVEEGIGKIPLLGSKVKGGLTEQLGRASRLKNNTTSAVASEIAKKIPYGDKLLKLKLKPEKKVAPEVEKAAKDVREKLEDKLKKRAGIYADIMGSQLQEEGKPIKEFNPTDCHGQGVKAKDYAAVVLHNTAIDIAREAMDYPEDKAKHAEYQKRRSEKLESQYMSSQIKWGLGVAALGGAYMMGVPGIARLVALPFSVASYLPVPGLRKLAGWTADVITANSEGVAGKALGGPIRMLTAGGTTLMGGSIVGEGGWNLTKKHLNVKELSQVPEAVTNMVDEWAKNHKNARVAHILAKGTRTTTRVAKSIAGKLWNSPETIQNTAKSVDGKLGSKPSQLAKKAQDTVSSWMGGSSEKAAAPKVAGIAEKHPVSTAASKSSAVKAEENFPPVVKRNHKPESSAPTRDIGVVPESVKSVAKQMQATQPAKPKVAQPVKAPSKPVGMVDRVMGSGLTTVASAGLVAGGLATAALLPVVGLPIGLVATAAGMVVLVYQGLQKMGL